MHSPEIDDEPFFCPSSRVDTSEEPTTTLSSMSSDLQLQPGIIGHRGGAARLFPENSVAAFRAGIEAGATGVELDVHLSRDRRVMVVHDPRIDRVSEGTGTVAAMGAAELRRYRLLAPDGTPQNGSHVPVLEEVIEGCGDGITFNIDLKTNNPELAREVAAIIARYGVARRCTVASFLPDALHFFRTIAPDVPTSTHPDEVRALLLARLRRDVAATPAARVQVPLAHGLLPIATPGFVRYVHRLGMAVDVWTLNTSAHIRRALRAGVDGIITDDVALAASVIRGTHDDK
jgi:glycerophosphoryl diester phosphodiesterase